MGKIALERAQKIANIVLWSLAPYCKKIEVAGSIRRKKPFVRDVDIMLIPSDPSAHDYGSKGMVEKGTKKGNLREPHGNV